MITKTAILKNLAGSKVYSSMAAALKDVQATLTDHHFATVKRIRSERIKQRKMTKKLGSQVTKQSSPGKGDR